MCGQEDAGNPRAKDIFWRTRRKVDTDVKGGEDLGEEDGGAEDDDHGVEDDGERALPFVFVVVGAIPFKDGDEGDGSRSAYEEVVDQLWEIKSCVVGVGTVGCAEFVGDILLADEANDAGEECGESK